MFSYSEVEVPLADIHFDDRTYRITTDIDKDDISLRQSISGVGLLSPPILYQVPQRHQFMVVTGFRRLAALRSLNISRTHCRLLNQTVTPLDGLKIAIIDNTWQRPLNPVEQARAIEKLTLLTGSWDDLSHQASGLGLPSTMTAVQNLKSVLSLSESVLNNIAAGRIAVSTALVLSSVDPETAVMLSDLFVDLRLGGNKQRTAMSLIDEISRSEDVTIQQLLGDTLQQKVIKDRESDRALRSDYFFRYLRSRRFPNISSVEAEFSRKVKVLKPGAKARLTPPPDFEGMDYGLQLRFRDRKDLEHHLALIKRIADSDLLEDA